MNEADHRVIRILDYLEERIDLEHVAQATARQQAALNFAESDRPPLVLYVPYEGRDIAPYSYSEAFADPAKMMVNELLVGFTSIYHAVDLRDDAPYCLRPNLGTGLIASMFGAEIRLVDDNPPWVMPLVGPKKLQEIVEGPLPSVKAGLGQRAADQYAYFKDAVANYPRCQQALRFTLPDLQGPFSTAELLWGSGIYVAVYDQPELMCRLMGRITEQMLAVHQFLSGMAIDHLQQGCYQHAVAVRGRLLIRDDSMVNLSARHYRQYVLPFDARIGRELGSIGVHFCGNGEHQVPNLLEIPNLSCLDLGNPDMMDLDRLYALAATHKVALLRLSVPEPELNAARLKSRFPQGVIFTHTPHNVAHARELLTHYLA